jgi:hypothetical protein
MALLLLALLAGCGLPPTDSIQETDEAQEVRDLVYFLRRLRQVDHLPELERAHTALASTWDRSGGNEDGKDFKQLSGDRNVLLDVEGPGCVHRLYTGLLEESVQGTRIQIFVDDLATPLFDLPVQQFFSESEGVFPYPLLTERFYPGSHFPIPFSERCRIQLTSDQPDKHWGIHWQVTYTTYPEGTPVRSLSWPPSAEEQEELGRVLGAWLVALWAQPEPPKGWSVEQTLTIPAEGAQEVALSGAGVIRELRVAAWPGTPEVLQGVRVLATWDGGDHASVDVPLGYFFGHGDLGGDGAALFDSLLLGVTPEEAYSRFPMPFASGAVLRFENRSASAVKLRVRLDLEARASLPAAWGRFHATWRQEPAMSPDSPLVGPQSVPAHLVLERSGRGKYVGVLLHLSWPYLWSWWGEGDWLIWTDESGWPPSYHGTGTEEYFNSGWTLFDRKPVSGYVSVRPGPVGLYSFHLNDAFQFQERIRVMVETQGSFGGEQLLPLLHPQWGTTAYWYALPAQPARSL